LFVVLFYLIAGLFFLYKSKKTNAKLLFYMGLVIIFDGLIWSAVVIDFLTILTTDNNFNPVILFPVYAHMWVGLVMICGFYLVFELLFSNRKKKIIFSSFYGIVAIIFELFVFLDPQNNYNIITPANPGEDILDFSTVSQTPVSTLMAFLQISVLIFYVFGFLYKSFQSTGVVRKKYRYLSIGFLIFITCSLLDTFLIQGLYVFIIRIIMISSVPFWYLGLREEPEKKIPAKKEVKIKDSLFRIIERPAQITEEEVTYYKEQKICLVCKGKVAGFNIFLCPNCEALYHEDCARTLSDLENTCWVCNEPIDKSKPSKPFQIIEESKEDDKTAKKDI
jgi:hypothetical protein